MIYEILDKDGNISNTIVADVEFMQKNYPDGNYRELPEPVITPQQTESPTQV